jgi:hypothetical protein
MMFRFLNLRHDTIFTVHNINEKYKYNMTNLFNMEYKPFVLLLILLIVTTGVYKLITPENYETHTSNITANTTENTTVNATTNDNNQSINGPNLFVSFLIGLVVTSIIKKATADF